MVEHPDDIGFQYATDAELDLTEAFMHGAKNPDRAWILTDCDVWHRNPFYHGPEVPHPEDYNEGSDDGDEASDEDTSDNYPMGYDTLQERDMDRDNFPF